MTDVDHNEDFELSSRINIRSALIMTRISRTHMQKTSGTIGFFSGRRRNTGFDCDWSSGVCSSDQTGQDLQVPVIPSGLARRHPFLLERTREVIAKRGNG